ncbi:hypothetical protein CJP74_07140 [Psittacicella melopsittaci]|uniref:Uncharacterized protein n=1 Tax=Psittacicella melopsittaci TaxID=2028576 RepID=A0A3A1Y2L6_9GAMM|nr:hypothetical protein [Psittacicella melopsittaci]RIY31529.1 hypothetical protein CJP74_07140 [Psittacicella melopsittaci]
MSEKEVLTHCQVEKEQIDQELAIRLEAANKDYLTYNFDAQGNPILTELSSPEISLDLECQEIYADEQDPDLNEFVSWLDATVTSKELDQQAVYALIRFSNEVVTLKQSLNSLLPAVTKGVLITHPTADGLQDDGSLQVAAEFVQQNPGFSLVIYPHPVYHENHPIYQEQEKIKRENYLDTFTNFGIEALKSLAEKNGDTDPWVFKADADQIYDASLLSEQFEQILAVPSNHIKVNYFVKLDLHYAPETDTLYYLRTKIRSTNFLVKAKYLHTGMVIEEDKAKEVYFFEDQQTDKFTFKQSLKGLGNFFKYRFMHKDKRNSFKEGVNNHGKYASLSEAQRYALHTMREIPANYTGFLNSIHFKYLKHVHSGNCIALPAGMVYQDFLASQGYRDLLAKYPALAQSNILTSPDVILSCCHNMNFRKAHEFKALRDFYAQLRLASSNSEV